MQKTLQTVDNLFASYGWFVNKTSEAMSDRVYYKKHFELDRFEVKPKLNGTIRTIIPMSHNSYTSIIPEYALYDYIYDHLTNYQNKSY